MPPIFLSGLLGYLAGQPPDLTSAIGLAGLISVEEVSGLPVSLLPTGRSSSFTVGLLRGVVATAAYARFGFAGALASALAYEVGGAIRGDVR